MDRAVQDILNRPAENEDERALQDHVAEAEHEAFLINTTALLARTRHLTTEEFGALMLAMMFIERNGRVEYLDDSLAVAAGIPLDRWELVRSKIAPLMNVRGGYFYALWADIYSESYEALS